jgi:UDP-N-acetylmuramate dehydrogenase
MKRTSNASLKHLNSFSVEARAWQLLELETTRDLQQLTTECHFDPARDLVLGGGSNILFAGDIDGTVIMNRLQGKSILPYSDDEVLLDAHAGENWHQLVLWSLEQGFSGLENLSLIPGLAGAAPMQNIGAYGVELSDLLDSVQALDLKNGIIREFSHHDCHFGYRDSRFKSSSAERYLITRIRLRLRRHFQPRLAYAGLKEELSGMGIVSPTAKQVSEAVIRIRQRKLPDPQTLGNAGSFFKNPIVSQTTAENLQRDFAGLPAHPAGQDMVKISAAWLIEQCGWKGRSMGAAGVSSRHALVLVNHDNATGNEILELANAIQDSVQDRFGIGLQTEPLIIRS